MTKYIYDMTLLRPGDIIMVRYPNNEVSQRVMESTHSEFSHAMIYVDGSSYIEADCRVQARNLARCLFDDTADTCVLRIKEQYLNPNTIDAAVYYARFVVGNPYSIMDALRLEDGRTEAFSFDTQICTRLVAKAYAFSGLKIVDNIEMCTPQELVESRCVEVHRDLLREANSFDIKFAATYDVTDDMVKATETLFDSIKNLGDGKIRSMNALVEHVIKYPADDEQAAEELKQSGYLSVLNIEEEKNRYNYDKNEFLKFYEDKSYIAAIQSLGENLSGQYRYELEYKDLVKRFFYYEASSHFLIQMISLYKQIIEQYDRRIHVCYEVMESLES